MSERRKQLCKAELENLSVSIGIQWVTVKNGLAVGYKGRSPTLEQLEENQKLTARYRQARELFEQGHYLSCLEVLTAEEAHDNPTSPL